MDEYGFQRRIWVRRSNVTMFTVIGILLCSAVVVGQSSSVSTESESPVVTPWGDPDLQGVWADGAIRYTFIVTDPTVWTRSWTGMVPWRKTEAPIYEYACHEGNYGMEHILSAAFKDR